MIEALSSPVVESPEEAAFRADVAKVVHDMCSTGQAFYHERVDAWAKRTYSVEGLVIKVRAPGELPAAAVVRYRLHAVQSEPAPSAALAEQRPAAGAPVSFDIVAKFARRGTVWVLVKAEYMVPGLGGQWFPINVGPHAGPTNSLPGAALAFWSLPMDMG